LLTFAVTRNGKDLLISSIYYYFFPLTAKSPYCLLRATENMDFLGDEAF